MKRKLDLFEYNDNDGVGRLRTITPSQEIAIAEKLEANMMTKAQFNALAEERKANRAGSGFDVQNNNTITNTFWTNVQDGMKASTGIVGSGVNMFTIGGIGSASDTADKITINGVYVKLSNVNSTTARSLISMPTAPNVYPHDTVLTTEQIASGVIKHADASNSGLITNGKFDTNTSGWTNSSTGTGTFTYNAGKVSISGTNSSNRGSFSQTLGLVIGKNYTVECDVNDVVGLVNIAGTSVGGGGQVVVNGRNYFTFTATSTGFFIYTQASGGSATFDNIAVYPADAISRSDLVLLESWHEDISEKNFVYPLGNVQYLGANTDGLTGIANGAFTGFETYSLFGNWQTPSALIGKGYVWSNLTEAQKIAFTANPENNCYLDGDKVIQVRYRVRVVQGAGDNWFNVDPQSVSSLAYNTILYVQSKGKSSNISSDLSSVGTSYFNSGKNNIGESGVWIAFNISHGYEGKCFALPIALVHR